MSAIIMIRITNKDGGWGPGRGAESYFALTRDRDSGFWLEADWLIAPT